MNSTATTQSAPNEPMRTNVGRDKRLLRVGIFTLFGIGVLLIAVFAISERDNIFSRTFPVLTRFKSAEGLKPGANVMLNGIKIGTVTDIKLGKDTTSYVTVELAVQEKYHHFIHTTTTTSIAQQGLIGDKLIELDVDDIRGDEVKDGGFISSTTSPGVMGMVDDARGTMKKVDQIAGKLDTILGTIKSGQGTLGKLVSNDGLYNNLTEMMGTANNTLQQTTRTLQSLTQMASGSMKNADALMNDSRKMVNTLNRDLDAVTHDISRVTDILDTVARDSRVLLSRVQNRQGTLGALLNERSLYDSLTAMTSTLRQMLRMGGWALREFGLTVRGMRGGLIGKLMGSPTDEQKELEDRLKALELKEQELQNLQDSLKKAVHP